MASFYFNPFSKEHFLSQWQHHLQNKAYLTDLKIALKDSVDSFENVSNRNVDQLIKTQLQNTSNIVGSIQSFSSEISENMLQVADKITKTLEDLGGLFDWRMSQMLDQQKITNLLMKNIALLLRIPDFQKERQYYLEQGFKHYKNARNDPELYKDALNNLLKALELEPTDYLVLHRIGIIHLFQPEFLDVSKAEDYFRKAGKYAAAESYEDSVMISNLLRGDVSENLHEQKSEVKQIKQIAAESFFQAGIACYIQGKFKEAIALSKKAYELNPTLIEAKFNIAKFLTANNEVEDAIPIIYDLLSDKLYALKISKDIDIASKSQITDLLFKYKEDTIKNASFLLSKCKLKDSQSNIEVINILNKIEKLINNNNLISGLSALDELSKLREWDINIISYEYSPETKHQYIDGNSIGFSPDSKKLAISSFEKIILFDVLTWETEKIFNSSKESFNIVTFSPNGSVIATGSLQNELKLWDVDNRKLIKSFGSESIDVDKLVFTPDGNILISGSPRGISLWDVNEGKLIKIISTERPISLAISPLGNILASGEKSRLGLEGGLGVNLWNISTGKKYKSILKNKSIYSLSFNSDGRILACGSYDGDIKLYDIHSEEILKTFYVGKECVHCVAFSPDGFFLASSDDNKNAILFFILNGQKISIQGQPTYNVECIAFSPNGLFLASVGKDGFIKLRIYAQELQLKLNLQDFINFNNKYYNYRHSTMKKQTDYQKKADFVKFENEQKKKKEKEELQSKIRNILLRAIAEENRQNRKLFFKDYTYAIKLYEDAAHLGDYKAQRKADELKKIT